VKRAKFLEDQEIVFSQGLNCIIGGRGSGKSSVLEYLRFALISDETAAQVGGSGSLDRKRAHLKQSLSAQGAEVRITFQVDSGVTDTLVYQPSAESGRRRYLEGRDVTDIDIVLRQLRAQFFSQGELSQMTGGDGGQAQVLEIIDIASGDSLTDLQKFENELQNRLKNLFQATSERNRLLDEIKTASQEETELNRQLAARIAVQGDAANNQLARKATQYIDARLEEADSDVLAVDSLRAELSKPRRPLPEDAQNWPAAKWFSDVASATVDVRQTFVQELDQATRKYERSLEGLIGDAALVQPLKEIQAAKEQFLSACTARGIDPGDIARMEELEQSRLNWVSQLERLREDLSKVAAMADEFPETLSALHENWTKQFEVRKETAAAIQSAVPSQTVNVQLQFMYDKAAFLREWKRLQPRDGRGKLARNWDELGDDVFESWKQRGSEKTPWETVEAGRKDPRAILYFTGGLNGVSSDDLQPQLISYIDTQDARPIWEALRITRISDGIDVELLRDDGTVAGTMRGNLSEGQRNTVLLNLVLARGNGPIIIDQPEDELDSSFIYKALVRDIRATKLKRQLIVATHNANLPVNGDAELIYALEARDGLGKCISQGGLDRIDVAKSVLDIMEGSEQAFKLRQEKYHF
jgi:ABC-type cobalamin/Fe3+-siderophores transport system ATPase subunit